MLISWIYVLLAIVSEVVSAACIKLSDGFSKILPTVCTLVFYTLCISFISLALKKLDLSKVYAIWAGLATVGIALESILLFDESVSLAKVGAILLVITGVVVLNIAKEGKIVETEKEEETHQTTTLTEEG